MIQLAKIPAPTIARAPELAVMLVPAQHAWLAYALVGGTMVMVYWWVWGKIFKNVGLVVD